MLQCVIDYGTPHSMLLLYLMMLCFAVAHDDACFDVCSVASFSPFQETGQPIDLVCTAVDVHANHLIEAQGSLSEGTLSAAVLCLLWTLYVSVGALAQLQEDSKAVTKAKAQTRAAAMSQIRDRGFHRSLHSRGSVDAAALAVQETAQALLTNELRQTTFKAELDFLKGIAGTQRLGPLEQQRCVLD